MTKSWTVVLVAGLALGVWGSDARAQEDAQGSIAQTAVTHDEVVRMGLDVIVGLEENETSGQWPYEGVYRVGRQIPVGYKVGGTAIACLALALSPGFADDDARLQAVGRGIDFIAASTSHALMNPEYDGGYDVRGWGYTYALLLLLELEKRSLIPDDRRDVAKAATHFYLSAIQSTEIPQAGGWNYARGQGRNAVSPASPFMTGPTLQALFLAASLNYDIDSGVVERALASLERGRAASGELVYSGDATERRAGGVPGATGRMLIAESTLFLAGRSSQANIRGALDAFIVHWDHLEARRAKSGTHEPPYGVAPYYFYYAHLAAAQAIELLPQRERAEYRRRVTDLLMKTRADDGSWNDRVFERSAAYGTAMALLALQAPSLGSTPRWVQPLPPATPEDSAKNP